MAVGDFIWFAWSLCPAMATRPVCVIRLLGPLAANVNGGLQTELHGRMVRNLLFVPFAHQWI